MKSGEEHQAATTRAAEIYRQRIEIHQMTQNQSQPAPRFDYIRWKQQEQHRMHHNPDEYVRTCQGLAPYINAVASSSWEGMDEERWAGMTTAPPPLPMTGVKSNVGSRSGLASRDQGLVSRDQGLTSRDRGFGSRDITPASASR